MSVFGGKADIVSIGDLCLLMTQSGHSAVVVLRPFLTRPTKLRTLSAGFLKCKTLAAIAALTSVQLDSRSIRRDGPGRPHVFRSKRVLRTPAEE